MFNFLALLFLAFLFAVLILYFIYYLDERFKQSKNTKKPVIFLVVLAASAVLFFLVDISLSKIYLTTPEISYVGLKKVYKNPEYNLTVSHIVEDSNDNAYGVYVKDVFKGESNYLITYTQPKLNKFVAFLIDENIKEYALVLKDPDNISKISSISD